MNTSTLSQIITLFDELSVELRYKHISDVDDIQDIEIKEKFQKKINEIVYEAGCLHGKLLSLNQIIYNFKRSEKEVKMKIGAEL